MNDMSPLEAAALLIDCAKKQNDIIAMHMTAHPELDNETFELLRSSAMTSESLSVLLAKSVCTIINQDELLERYETLVKNKLS